METRWIPRDHPEWMTEQAAQLPQVRRRLFGLDNLDTPWARTSHLNALVTWQGPRPYLVIPLGDDLEQKDVLQMAKLGFNAFAGTGRKAGKRDQTMKGQTAGRYELDMKRYLQFHAWRLTHPDRTVKQLKTEFLQELDEAAVATRGSIWSTDPTKARNALNRALRWLDPQGESHPLLMRNP
jgi:hypothetical protein